MEIKLRLALPRDEVSIPVVRRVLSQSLSTLGVAETCTADIALALSEACTNVLNHVQEGQEYEVSAAIDDDACVIEVADRGAGISADATASDRPTAGLEAEEGRGIHLMRQLVDALQFQAREPYGTVVRLEKGIEWRDDAPARRLQPATGELDIAL